MGRMAGPFDKNPFPTFRVSTVSLLPKKDGNFRLIHHLSCQDFNSATLLTHLYICKVIYIVTQLKLYISFFTYQSNLLWTSGSLHLYNLFFIILFLFFLYRYKHFNNIVQNSFFIHPLKLLCSHSPKLTIVAWLIMANKENLIIIITIINKEEEIQNERIEHF